MVEIVCPTIISLQHDWEVALSTQTKEAFWISSSSFDNQTHRTASKHGEVTLKRQAGILSAESTPPFSASIVSADAKWLKIQAQEGRNAVDVFAPLIKFQESSKKAVRSLGLSPQGGLGVYGSEDGVLRVWDVQDGSIQRTLEGHKGDVTFCGFFPSGQVVLSGALDWRLKIWSITTGDCAATLTGHGGSILGADYIERGRNIVSCSRDGTAKLWDVPTQMSITTFTPEGQHGEALNGCFVFGNEGGGEGEKDAREVGTEGKAIALAGENGTLSVFDVRSRKQVAAFPAPPTTNTTTIANEGQTSSREQTSSINQTPRPTAYNCCAAARPSGSPVIVGGTESGHVVAWDMRAQAHPLHTLRISSSAIKKLAFSTYDKLWVATGDGSVLGLSLNWTTNPNLEKARLAAVLTGSDCEPIFGLGVVGKGEGTVAVAGARDGFVRSYWLPANE